MTKHVLLNNVDHKNLRIKTERSAALGDSVMYVQTFPAEFRNVQAEYPIFFIKDSATNRFQAVAMFGFENGQNLYLNDDGWNADYVPMMIERQPFLIGFQERSEGGVSTQHTVIHIDMDNPRVNETDGEEVFLEHGGTSDYLGRVNDILHTINEGLQHEQEFMNLLEEHSLLESFTLDVELDSGAQHRLVGFYTINEEKLKEMSGDDLAMMNKKNFLQPCFMQIASMSCIRNLVRLRNALDTKA